MVIVRPFLLKDLTVHRGLDDWTNQNALVLAVNTRNEKFQHNTIQKSSAFLSKFGNGNNGVTNNLALHRSQV